MSVISRLTNVIRNIRYKLSGYNLALNSYVSINSSITKKNIIGSGVRLENVTLNNYTYISANTLIRDTQIGKYCSLGKNIKIGLANHPLNFISTSPFLYKKNFLGINTGFEEKYFEDEYYKTEIGNDVWIGDNVIICGGVKIGDGVVIGTGAIVTTDLDDYGIYVGVPAKMIKYRSIKDDLINNDDLEWWEYPQEKLIKILKKYEL